MPLKRRSIPASFLVLAAVAFFSLLPAKPAQTTTPDCLPERLRAAAQSARVDTPVKGLYESIPTESLVQAALEHLSSHTINPEFHLDPNILRLRRGIPEDAQIPVGFWIEFDLAPWSPSPTD